MICSASYASRANLSVFFLYSLSARSALFASFSLIRALILSVSFIDIGSVEAYVSTVSVSVVSILSYVRRSKATACASRGSSKNLSVSVLD